MPPNLFGGGCHFRFKIWITFNLVRQFLIELFLYIADKVLREIDFDKNPDAYITVAVDEVLDALGIQKKTKNGYTAVYKREDREEIFWQIRNLACIYVTFPKREYVKGKPEYKFVSSPVLEIAEIEYFVDHEGSGING